MQGSPLLILFCAGMFLLFACRKEAHHHEIHCEHLVTDTLGTNDSCRIYLPSAFTPNGDGSNDIFMPAAFYVKSITFQIYNDCDDLIFTSGSVSHGWTPQGDISYNKNYYCRVQAITSENHHIGLCGELKVLKCIPESEPLNAYIFSDQFGYEGPIYATSEVLMPCD